MSIEINSIKNYLFEIINDAGKILLDNISKVKVTNKNFSDIKINTDYIIEDHIITKIVKKYSNHNIYSEEAGNIDKDSDYTWIIDPIDGSYHYFKKLPLFAISVALKNKKSTLISTILNPLTNEFFWATLEEGAFLNNTKINVSKTSELKNSFLLIDFPNGKIDENILNNSFNIMKSLVKKTYRTRVYGVSSLSICYVASGKADAYISLSPRTRIYDKTAGIFILEMAKGKVTDSNTYKIPLLLCSNKKIHNELLEAIIHLK